MAGLYPDVPAPRMAYDRDGTYGILVNSSGSTSYISEANLQQMNDEDGGTYNHWGEYDNRYLAFIFPEQRDISGYLFQMLTRGFSRGAMQWSNDTTNGYDGSWTNIESPWAISGGYSLGNMRNSIHSVSVTNVRAIRFHASTGNNDYGRIYCFHLYGAKTSHTGLDTLRVWHPTLDEPLDDNTSADGAWLDWGEVVQGTSADRTFRIKNNSSTLTANSITVSSEVFTNTTPTLESQVVYSDGGSFASSINIGNLAPGAVSSVITVRKITDINASLSLWTLRTNVEAGSWS